MGIKKLSKNRAFEESNIFSNQKEQNAFSEFKWTSLP